MDEVTSPDKLTYYAQVAASDQGRNYKRQVLAALDLGPGQTVLDVGCGPGTDLADMAKLVTETGAVLGVDKEQSMVEEAGRRLAEAPWVEVRTGDAHRLPIPDRSVDKARADRMIQHVKDPAAVLREFHRVLRPGGVACMAEPDWDTLVVDPGDVATNRAFNHFVCTKMVRNATIGRQLPRLAAQADLEVCEVQAATPLFRNFAEADHILGLTRNTERAIQAGYVDRQAGQQWLENLTTGPFLATSMIFIATVRRPTTQQR